MLHIGPVFRSLMRRKLGACLLIIQIGFSVAIFANLSYAIGQLGLMLTKPTGVAEDRLFGVVIRPTTARNILYADTQSNLDMLRQLPGVEAVETVRWLPLSGTAAASNFRIRPEKDATITAVSSADVGVNGLKTLGLKIQAGRDFTRDDMSIEPGADMPGPNNIIVTRALADALFGKDENAVGKIIYDGDQARQIIGVADNWMGFTLAFPDAAEKTAFLPHYVESETEHRYLIRTASAQDRPAVIEAVEKALNTTYQNSVMLESNKVDEFKRHTLNGSITVSNELRIIIVALGLVISFAISGQTLFWVNQRVKQFGIRRALGASKQDILILVILEAGMVSSIGIALGLVCAVLANQALIPLVPDWLPMSPLLLVYVSILLLMVALLSAAVPAWRASSVSPSIATRSV